VFDGWYSECDGFTRTEREKKRISIEKEYEMKIENERERERAYPVSAIPITSRPPNMTGKAAD